MSTVSKTQIVSLVCLLSLAAHLWAATYYVDFDTGSDAAAGTSPKSAWKHCPGDPQATGTPKAATLTSGDTVIFKGGVHYRGYFDITVSGAADKPIIFDGNAGGTFGKGRAILDGGAKITGWKRCDSADEVKGNPRWKDIYHAEIERDVVPNMKPRAALANRQGGPDTVMPWQKVVLFCDGKFLVNSQHPNQKDRIYDVVRGLFFKTPNMVSVHSSVKISYEDGTRGGGGLPITNITKANSRTLFNPFNGGAVSFEFSQPTTVSAIGMVMSKGWDAAVPDRVALLADGKEICVETIDPPAKLAKGKPAWARLQWRFELPRTITARKLTFRIFKSGKNVPKWTNAINKIAAYAPDGTDLTAVPVTSCIKDEKRLLAQDPDYYTNAFVTVFAGNNMAFNSRITRYDPQQHEIYFGELAQEFWKTTHYSVRNCSALIDMPGEWCIEPAAEGRSRVYLFMGGKEPTGVSYGRYARCIKIDKGASHIQIKNFIIQNYSGSFSGAGVRVGRAKGTNRSRDIEIADCEIHRLSAGAGVGADYCDDISVKNCHIHHCKGWTTGIYLNRVKGFRVEDCVVDKVSGEGMRNYECKNGVFKGNYITRIRGQHATGLSLFEGCANIVVERNHLKEARSIYINRNAENLVFRNNLIDGAGKSALSVAIFNSGSVGGTEVKNLHFLNNTFLNNNTNVSYACSILGQHRGSPSAPRGLVIKNNILDRPGEDVSGAIENNIYIRPTDKRYMGKNCRVITDLDALFVDPANGDYRLKPGSPAIDAGADLAPPPIKTAAQEEKETLEGALDAVLEGGSDDATTVLGVAVSKPKPTLPETDDLPAKAYTVSTDLENTPRPQGQAFDIGAYEYKE